MAPHETQDEINEREWRKIYNWSGPFGSYSSTEDTRLWVPKRPGTGIGNTLNFGQRGAKVALAAMLVPAVGVMLLLAIVFLYR